ncbi:MAG: heme biosynthesis protein HemY [Alphaproteobacteria bacterium]
MRAKNSSNGSAIIHLRAGRAPGHGSVCGNQASPVGRRLCPGRPAPERPGSVTLVWEGWRLDTTVPVLAGVLLLVVAVLAYVARLLLAVRRLPRRLGVVWGEHRRRKGYLALSEGYVAVAAGDAARAQRLAVEAQKRLKDPSLTLLLSAQAAELAGDQVRAMGHYDALRSRPDTEVIGLRGLIVQARRAGRRQEALEHAERAVVLRPKAEWAVRTLFEEQVAGELWAEAEATLNRGARSGAMAGNEQHLKAVLATVRAERALAGSDRAEAIRLARLARDRDPDLVAASLLLVRLLVAEGKDRKAAAVVEDLWKRAPHPALGQAYLGIWSGEDPLRRAQRADRLVALNPDHGESRIVAAQAALEAQLWGQARQALAPLVGTSVSRRVAGLMARLEQAERGDMVAVNEWLRRANEAAPDPTWRCSACGFEAEVWHGRCPACRGFDTLKWSAPSREVVAVPGTHDAA